MSQRDNESILDKIVAWILALAAAIRQGASNLIQYYRNLLANYGYGSTAYV